MTRIRSHVSGEGGDGLLILKIYISGVWGPLHFYLIGFITKIFPAWGDGKAPEVINIMDATQVGNK
jgi:hypothetical protein